MTTTRLTRTVLLSTALAIFAFIPGCSGTTAAPSAVTEKPSIELLNVSYDPTRELWKDLNDQFAAKWKQEQNQVVNIKQSHGGSGSQARAVNDGLEADVVTLAMWPDTDLIRRSKLLADGWEDRLPDRSLPYYSTIVFVVRKGNPKKIKDWPDIVRDGVQIVTPNPLTSGNGKLSFLAAWGAVTTRGGSEADAKKFVTRLYQQTPVLDTAARAATITFSKKNVGDVHLTWENEAHLEVQESKGELELVYPPVSFRAEPHVAWVDGNVTRHGTQEVAKAYLEFLYTPEAQKTIGKHFYRPIKGDIRSEFTKTLPDIELFEITDIAKGWDDANVKFFNDGGVFDQIYEKK